MLKSAKLLLWTAGLIAVFANAQVPLDCGSKKKPCPPVDPCKINPDRCKDKGGPIPKGQKSDTTMSQRDASTTKNQKNATTTKKHHKAKTKGQQKSETKDLPAQPK